MIVAKCQFSTSVLRRGFSNANFEPFNCDFISFAWMVSNLVDFTFGTCNKSIFIYNLGVLPFIYLF